MSEVPGAPSDRYVRQSIFREIGAERQRRIQEGCAAVVGVGALGCQEAALLARAGVGRLVLIDRDFVERTNLQRQILFDEDDAKNVMPKAAAAARHLGAANRDIRIDAFCEDLVAGNAERLLSGVDVIVDGSDNFEVRYLLNDFAVSHGVPWIYAAAVGTTGLFMPVVPAKTPCLRCVFEEPPPRGSTDTCDTAGVLGPTTSIVGSLAALEALKLLAGREDAVRRGLLQCELWENEMRAMSIDAPRGDCPCCAKRQFPFLEGAAGGGSAALCGRNAVQVAPPRGTPFDFAAVRERLARSVEVVDNGYLVRFRAEGRDVVLFQDGRAIVRGTDDVGAARALYARFVGA